ncbi:hypothetical protein NQZ79_g2260 [Umbelopsis isabellina]|nr:hypothetical protein NQZ79_g2260 [Umbelopsis isabellina]
MRVNIKQLSRKLSRQLLKICDNDTRLAQRELHWMLDHVLANKTDSTRSHLTLGDTNKLINMVTDRVEHHKPLQYILGTQPFCELDIITRPPTLIPRWETEEWVYRLLAYIKESVQTRQIEKPLRVLDLCTGSGCIALALARHLPAHSAHIQAVDVSASALDLARLNAHELAPQLSNSVNFSSMDILSTNQFSDVPFDLIVSNPPYVTHAEYDALTPDVKNWEDPGALVAENDGMAFHLHIAKAIGTRGILSPRLAWPRLVMEIGGSHQVGPITNVLHENGLKNVQVWKDLAGKDRAIAAG